MMGSSYFYLEFLLSWWSILAASGYKNPAIFSLDYTLAPEGVFPTQLSEAARAYEHVLSVAKDPSRVVVSGDSAGATIILSLLLYIGNPTPEVVDVLEPLSAARLAIPGMAVLISPWVKLQSRHYRSTRSDYLDAGALAAYAAHYAGGRYPPGDEDWLVSPGNCKSKKRWKKASPTRGFFVTYGEEEVFAPEIRLWADDLEKDGVDIQRRGDAGGIHAWAVASLYLGRSTQQRVGGLKVIVDHIAQRIPPPSFPLTAPRRQ